MTKAVCVVTDFFIYLDFQMKSTSFWAKKNRHLQSSDDFHSDILLLFNKTTVILAAVKDIFYIDRIILDLVKDKIPLFNEHLVIFIRRDIQFLKVRETLWHLF